MALDLEQLLAPVSEDAPAGADLSYDPERYEIEQAFESSVSIDASGAESEAADVDWRKIVGLIDSQSAKTKDLWLPVYLCRAGARSGQLATVEVGASYLAGMLERYWETLHPQLEEYGFQGRKGPCDSLTRVREFLGPLQKVILLEHPRLGSFTGADFERFRANADAEDGYGQFRAALQESSDEDLLATVASLAAIRSALGVADGVLTEHAEGDTAPNFKPVYETLDQLSRAVLSFTSTPVAATEDAEETAEGAGGEGAPGGEAPGPRIGGRVETREDVIKALDAIADYYRRKEPASPVPLVLRRAREWVTQDFLAVLEDIAPGSLDEARRVLVSRSESGG